MDALEKIFCLRPYSTTCAATNLILGELEAKVDESFTIADLIHFADGAEEYVRNRWNKDGCALVSSQRHWPGRVAFHKDLAVLWEELDAQVHDLLKIGTPVVQVMDKMEQDLTRANQKKCSIAARFRFD